MFELTVEGMFSAAHQVKGYPGDCAGIHGHTYKVQVKVRVEKLDKLGMGMDFRSMKRDLDKILKKLDHKHLNKISFFKKYNATAEYIAKYIFGEIKKQMKNVASVTVGEGPNYSVTYYADET